MANNPMQQFSVYKIGPEIKIAGVDLSFTNASLFMSITTAIIILFLFVIIETFVKSKVSHNTIKERICKC